jgi:hypothetical protein
MDDGRRLRVMAEVRAELQSSASREKFLMDMANAGWDRDGLARLDIDSFVRHAAIFRLAEDSR